MAERRGRQRDLTRASASAATGGGRRAGGPGGPVSAGEADTDAVELSDAEREKVESDFLNQTRWWPLGDGLARLSDFPADFTPQLLEMLVKDACELRAASVRAELGRLQEAVAAKNPTGQRVAAARAYDILRLASCEQWVRQTPLARAIRAAR